ncbi:hypothetical protein BU24DRAFT_430834 [Aaosphaeria arxii CBS 175.79]|uniref:Uncharacterized protein n=1 Tax=Aaosphaeria arxii CBS 175.79 TaxID=1450172 RepID=A0A6A5Y185_9PLEO|nr:uncharacterized protein BU24DRAFT_430834 [Aaosphaeria arxii CBS 175.79]KAF2018681.1 hypothetical protein BU24DRAFT_430834 [Aaosphaeria arxii CBS 175.79]
MIGLSLALGLNLASSLKSYAVTLRWSLLTRRYVSLEVFDLILSLETLTKVGKLMIISFPGVRKFKFLKKLPWFREARDDGTRLTWLVCLLWLMVNVGAQVLVACLSLFWPVDPADATPLMKFGDVVVSDLNQWALDPIVDNLNASHLEKAWFAGNEAAAYPWFWVNQSKTDLSSLAGPPYYKIEDAYYEYRFLNRNPDHEFSQYLVSSRTVHAKATCEELVLESTEVEETEEGAFFVNAKRADAGPDANYDVYWLTEITTGSISWMASVYEGCGPRCTNYTIYQHTDLKDIKTPALFLCENTLGEVKGGENDFTGLSEQDRKALYSNDEFARIAAGAMGWTGYTFNSWYDRQTRSYTRGSKWAPYEMMTGKKEKIADMLAIYTIGAIAAFDDHGLRYTIKNQWTKPVQGQQLTVDWAWIFGLLGGIILIQTAALAALLAFANKSIIRDESHFSMAMLLNPVVSRLGQEGMNMTGDEIKTHPKLLWKRIRYDYREGKDGEPNQVSIFFQGKDMLEARRSWAGGNYI